MRQKSCDPVFRDPVRLADIRPSRYGYDFLRTELQRMMSASFHVFHAEDIHIEMQTIDKRTGGYHEMVYTIDFHCPINF